MFSDVSTTSGTLAPGKFATSLNVHARSEDLSSWARSKNLWAYNSLREDISKSAWSAIASLLGTSIVARKPGLSNGSSLAHAIGTDWTLPFVDTYVTLEYLSFWTEASLLVFRDKSEHVVEVVPASVLASLDVVWSASLPFLIGRALASWAASVVDKSPSAKEWNEVSVSPVVSADTTVARTLLGELVYGGATSLVGAGFVPGTVKDYISTGFVSDLVVADLSEFIVALHEVYIWIHNSSTVVEVWIGVCSPALVGKVKFALSTWEILAEWDVLALAKGGALSEGWLGFLDFDDDSSVILLWSADEFWIVLGALFGFDTLALDHWAIAFVWWAVFVVDDWLVIVWTIDNEWWAWWARVWDTESPVAVAHSPEAVGEVDGNKT